MRSERLENLINRKDLRGSVGARLTDVSPLLRVTPHHTPPQHQRYNTTGCWPMSSSCTRSHDALHFPGRVSDSAPIQLGRSWCVFHRRGSEKPGKRLLLKKGVTGGQLKQLAGVATEGQNPAFRVSPIILNEYSSWPRVGNILKLRIPMQTNQIFVTPSISLQTGV